MSQDRGAWSLGIRDRAVMVIFWLNPVRANQTRLASRGRLLGGMAVLSPECALQPVSLTAKPSRSAEMVRT